MTAIRHITERVTRWDGTCSFMGLVGCWQGALVQGSAASGDLAADMAQRTRWGARRKEPAAVLVRRCLRTQPDHGNPPRKRCCFLVKSGSRRCGSFAWGFPGTSDGSGRTRVPGKYLYKMAGISLPADAKHRLSGKIPDRQP